MLVDRHLSTEYAHGITGKIESLLQEKFEIHDTTVHIEPFDIAAEVGVQLSEQYKRSS